MFSRYSKVFHFSYPLSSLILGTLALALFFYAGKGHSEVLEEIISWETLSRDEVEEILVKTKLSEREEVTRGLIYAKAFMLQGDLESADFLLRKILAPGNQLDLVRRRYQASIEFIRGNYKKVLSALDHPFFGLPRYYRETCLLKILAHLSDGPTSELSREISLCNDANLTYSPTGGFWLNGLELVMRGDYERFPGTSESEAIDISNDNNLFRAWAKLALYSNLEEIVLARVPQYSYNIFGSQTTREILGFLYYRTGNLDEATRLTEDLEGPNVENIRGNLALKKQAYELALGHFQLALKKKSNSLNALGRALPLSWVLGRYQDGLELIDKVSFAKLDQNKKLLLKAAFTFEAGERELAQKIVEVLKSGNTENLPLEVLLLDQSTSLYIKDARNVKNTTLKACRKFDGISCWAQLAHFYWSDLSRVSKREGPILSKEQVDLAREALISPGGITPLQERVYINQRDIEELDGNALDEVIKKRELE